MLCPACSDKGIEKDMTHVKGTTTYANPADHHGYGEYETCWYECGCGYESDCDKDHSPSEE